MADGLSAYLGKITDDLAKLKTPNADARRQLLSALRVAQQEAEQKNIALAPGADIAALLGNLDAGDALAEATGVNDLLGGGIVGRGHYESFDPKWIQCLVNYYETRSHLRDFPSNKVRGIDPVKPLVGNPVGKRIRIAIAGDWGTGTTPLSAKPEDQAPFDSALAVANGMRKLNPDYTIHLGDVYYSGLPAEEANWFLRDWPRGAIGSYALNSNHEMYDGGSGYFDVLLADPAFARSQQGLSYFALTNDNWLIIGLDTAFLACHQSARYNEGYISDPNMPNGTDQLEWLIALLKSNSGKRVIMLTHHDGFSVNTVTGEITMRPLYNELTQLMTDVRDWWWYWGHVHNVVVYERVVLDNKSSVTPRCVGHGAIPYLPARPDLNTLGKGNFKAHWAESDLARKNGDPKRAPNGFVLITLTGADLHEEFYDEFGRLRWSNY